MIVYPLAQELFNEAFTHQVEKGRLRYQTLLKTFNGRNAYMDLLQEQADALVYGTQLYMEAVVLGDLLEEALDTIEELLPHVDNVDLLMGASEFATLARDKLESTGLVRDLW